VCQCQELFFVSFYFPNLLWVGENSFAIGLFLYQSFDAIDGKQARRTGTSGPLGEMFDHGQYYLFPRVIIIPAHC
jgi:phosphatidylglycerophosphate synthase